MYKESHHWNESSFRHLRITPISASQASAFLGPYSVRTRDLRDMDKICYAGKIWGIARWALEVMVENLGEWELVGWDIGSSQGSSAIVVKVEGNKHGVVVFKSTDDNKNYL